MTTNNPQYLFASDKLYAKDRKDFVPYRTDFELMTLVCHNVRPGEGNQALSPLGFPSWEFQIEGEGDRWFETAYSWALVLNTPENVAKLAAWKAKRTEIDALEWEARQMLKAITNVADVTKVHTKESA